MKKQDLLNLLASVKGGKTKIDDVISGLSATRGLVWMEESATKVSELKGDRIYTVKDNKLVSLPFRKSRANGTVGEFTPYYRTVKI